MTEFEKKKDLWIQERGNLLKPLDIDTIFEHSNQYI